MYPTFTRRIYRRQSNGQLLRAVSVTERGRRCGEKVFLLSAPALALMLAMPLYAQQLPPATDAGLLNNQLHSQQQRQMAAPSAARITLPADSTDTDRMSAPQQSATVVINRVQIQGLEGISESAVQQAIAGFTGKPLTFPALRAMADTVAALCRAHDMPLAQAVLPAQTITDGTLIIRVIPGHYDSPVISNSSRLRDGLVASVLGHQAAPGELVRQSSLEQAALLLGDIPGINSRLVLQPGQQPGSSAVSVQISEGKRYAGYLSLDNLGDPSTGRSRVIAGGYINELLGTGDQLQINLLDAWEKSGMLNGLADYSTIISGYGTRAGVNYSYLHYHYNLSGTGFSGYSDNWNLYLNHPWLRRSRARADIRLEGGQQLLHDIYPYGTVQNISRTVSAGALSLKGSVAGVPGGVTSFSLKQTLGSAGHSGLSFAAGRSSRFSRFNYYLNHLQQISRPLSFFLSVKGQIPGQNMDSSQKFILGGADAVRAYDSGTGVTDGGTLLSAELHFRRALGFSLAGTRPELNLAVFYDQGWGQQYKNNLNPRTGQPLLTRNNHISLAGAGMILSVAAADSYSLSLTWAHRTGEPDPVSGYRGRDRVWLSAVKTF